MSARSMSTLRSSRLSLVTLAGSAMLCLGCNTIVDKPVEDIARSEGFLDKLFLEKESSSKVSFRRYPLTLAIAPPIFEWRVIRDEEGNIVPPRVGNVVLTPEAPLNENLYRAEKLPGAEEQIYLTSAQSRVAPDRKDLAERNADAGSTGSLESGAPESGAPESGAPESGSPSAPLSPESGGSEKAPLTPESGTSSPKTPDSEPDTEPGATPGSDPGIKPGAETQPPAPPRRLRLGQRFEQREQRNMFAGLVGGRAVYRPLGLNTEDFERELNQRLYEPGYAGGYGDGEVGDVTRTAPAESNDLPKSEGKAEPNKDPSTAASGGEVTELKPVQSFVKENPRNWGEPTSTDLDVAERPGFLFGIEPTAFTESVKSRLDQFALFEEVKTLTGNLQDFQQILEDADNRYADLVMITTISRYKVAYHGISVGNWVGSFLTYITLWWPAIFWADEEFKVHLDVQVDINDVRSKSNVWSSQFKITKDGIYSDYARGWKPLSQYITPTFESYHGEAVYRNVAQQSLMALAWQEFERQLIEKLHNSFRTEVTSKIYQEKINDNVVPRSEGLVVGISKYGDKAKDVLKRLHQNSLKRANANDRYEVEDLRRDLGDPKAEFGVRGYAENDAAKIAEMLRNGQEVATPAYALTKLFGEKVTRAELLTRLHRMTRARREDRSFLYLNLETVLVDVDPEFSADGLAKFLLPHDCDLETLEAQLKPQRDQLEAARIAVLGPIESKLREAQRKLAGLSAESPEIPGLQAQISELAARYKSGCDRVLAEQASTLDAIKTRCLDFFDQNAISFAWLEKQFNRDTTKPLEDLVFLQSKNVVMVLDTTFPGQFTELAYAPRFELSLGAQPVSIINAATKETSAVPTSTPEVPTPPSEVLPPKPGEIEIQEPGGLPPKTGKQPEDGKTEESPGQESPGIESKPGDPKFEAPPKEQPEDEPEDESEEESKNRRRLKLGYFEALKRTFMAAGMQRQDGSAEASEAAIEQEQAGISNAFLKVLLRPGFIIVLSSMSSRRPLELADKEMSAFAYHLTRGAATEDRVQPFTTFNEKGQRTVQTRLIDVLNYVGSKVGRESRALGRPQEYGIFRKNKTDDFVLVQSTRER